MTDIEVLLTDLGEIATRDIATTEHPQGLEENIKVVCLDGEAVFKKNEDLQTRMYDTTNHAFKNRNII